MPAASLIKPNIEATKRAKQVAALTASLWKKTEAFLQEPYRLGARSWLTSAQGGVYVRKGMRFIPAFGEGVIYTFEIASVEIKESLRGQGWFKSYVRAIGHESTTPDVLVLESVQSPELLKHALKCWTPLPGSPNSFYITKEQASQF